MALTVEQRIARKEAELARLKAGRRQLENGQKIILGGMLLQLARTNPRTTAWTLKNIRQLVTRPVDLLRIASLVEELEKLPHDPPVHTRPSSSVGKHDDRSRS